MARLLVLVGWAGTWTCGDSHGRSVLRGGEDSDFGTTSRMQRCCRNLSYPILFLPLEGQAYSLPAPPSCLTIAEEWCKDRVGEEKGPTSDSSLSPVGASLILHLQAAFSQCPGMKRGQIKALFLQLDPKDSYCWTGNNLVQEPQVPERRGRVCMSSSC